MVSYSPISSVATIERLQNLSESYLQRTQIKLGENYNESFYRSVVRQGWERLESFSGSSPYERSVLAQETDRFSELFSDESDDSAYLEAVSFISLLSESSCDRSDADSLSLLWLPDQPFELNPFDLLIVTDCSDIQCSVSIPLFWVGKNLPIDLWIGMALSLLSLLLSLAVSPACFAPFVGNAFSSLLAFFEAIFLFVQRFVLSILFIDPSVFSFSCDVCFWADSRLRQTRTIRLLF